MAPLKKVHDIRARNWPKSLEKKLTSAFVFKMAWKQKFGLSFSGWSGQLLALNGTSKEGSWPQELKTVFVQEIYKYFKKNWLQRLYFKMLEKPKFGFRFSGWSGQLLALNGTSKESLWSQVLKTVFVQEIDRKVLKKVDFSVYT